MSSNRIQKEITRAIQYGEILKIRYHGGSQPGSVREIVPIRISEDKVFAVCIASDSNKSFFLDKIELPQGPTVQNSYDPDLQEPQQEPRLPSLAKAITLHQGELLDLGWEIALTEKHIYLHSNFKNGRPRKTPQVGVSFRPENRSRNWYVFSPGLPTAKTFSSLSEAIDLMMIHAREFAPQEKIKAA